jgi:hypothetical protein
MTNEHKIKLTGNSMSPFIKDGDTLTWYDKADSISIGDILIFHDQSTEEITCHRIVALDPIQTKGDNSYYLDAPLSTPPLGKVIALNDEAPKWFKYNNLIAILSRLFMTNHFLRKPTKLFFYLLANT